MPQFRAEVLTTLQAAFGARVEDGNKAIWVRKRSGFVDADVIACQTYKFFSGSSTGTTVPFALEGMRFFTQTDHRLIKNWPRLHYDEGVKKNAATNDYYKPTVRIFKNLRNFLYDTGALPTTAAPSYFVESLLFNVPNGEFGTSHKGNVFSAILWLYNQHEAGNFQNFVCGNGFISLFGDEPEKWDIQRAYRFVTACLHACAS